MKNTKSFSIVFLLILISCTTQIIKLNGIAENNNDLIYFHGQDVLISTKKISRVALSAKKENNLIKLRVLIQNISNERLNVFPEKIKIRGVKNNSSAIVDLKVYNPEKYIETIKANQSIALSLMALGGAFKAAYAGKTTTYSNATGYIGNSTINLNTYQTTIDYDKKNQVMQETTNNLISAKNKFDFQNMVIEMSLLRKHTLFSGDILEGYVLAEKKDEGYFTMDEESFFAYVIEIPLGEELHIFKFKLSKF